MSFLDDSMTHLGIPWNSEKLLSGTLYLAERHTLPHSKKTRQMQITSEGTIRSSDLLSPQLTTFSAQEKKSQQASPLEFTFIPGSEHQSGVSSLIRMHGRRKNRRSFT